MRAREKEQCEGLLKQGPPGPVWGPGWAGGLAGQGAQQGQESPFSPSLCPGQELWEADSPPTFPLQITPFQSKQPQPPPPPPTSPQGCSFKWDCKQESNVEKQTDCPFPARPQEITVCTPPPPAHMEQTPRDNEPAGLWSPSLRLFKPPQLHQRLRHCACTEMSLEGPASGHGQGAVAKVTQQGRR